jgi:predicted alpha/beta superfamily hydrolase
MKRFLSSMLFALCVFISFCCISKESDTISIGQSLQLRSEILNEERDIFVHLPDGYNQNKLNYPVLFVLDGDRHFSYSVGVEDFLSRVGRAPEMIVVGIPNINRVRDFSLGQEQNGRADEFIKFLEFELIPYIDSKYRTQPYRILNGWSLTGAFSIYTYFSKPGLFNGIIAMSPSFQPLYVQLIDHVRGVLAEDKPISSYLFFTLGDEPRLINYMERFVDLLNERSLNKDLWKYAAFKTEDHGSVRLKSLYAGLEFLFAGWPLTLNIAEQGAENVRAHYRKLSEHFGYEIEIPENFINQVGYELLLQDQVDKAIEIFQLNVETHPESANVYDSLGEAYERAGNLEKALENFEIAYEMALDTSHPNLDVFQTNLERMRKILEK